jgi:hypothetical protein
VEFKLMVVGDEIICIADGDVTISSAVVGGEEFIVAENDGRKVDEDVVALNIAISSTFVVSGDRDCSL